MIEHVIGALECPRILAGASMERKKTESKKRKSNQRGTWKGRGERVRQRQIKRESVCEVER